MNFILCAIEWPLLYDIDKFFIWFLSASRLALIMSLQGILGKKDLNLLLDLCLSCKGKLICTYKRRVESPNLHFIQLELYIYYWLTSTICHAIGWKISSKWFLLLYLEWFLATVQQLGMIFINYFTDFSYFRLKIVFRKLLDTVRTCQKWPFWKGL